MNKFQLNVYEFIPAQRIFVKKVTGDLCVIVFRLFLIRTCLICSGG